MHACTCVSIYIAKIPAGYCASFDKICKSVAGLERYMIVHNDRQVSITGKVDLYVWHVCKRVTCNRETGIKYHLQAHSKAISRLKTMEIIQF